MNTAPLSFRIRWLGGLSLGGTPVEREKRGAGGSLQTVEHCAGGGVYGAGVSQPF